MAGRFEGTGIPDPGFAEDDGSVAPAVADALAAYGADPGGLPEALQALAGSRVLVPVVALLGEVGRDEAGLAHEKSSDMAAVLVQGRDGRHGLLAFTGLEPMRRWDAGARPVPVSLREAARAALQEGAEALLVDLAGPVPLAITGQDLEGLARGWTLARAGDRSVWLAGPAGT